jgi:hypothetical protein
MSILTPLPSDRLVGDDFIQSIEADDLVYFCANVGDGDAQLVLLPEDDFNRRRLLFIDAGRTGKLPSIVRELENAGMISFDEGEDDLQFPVALIVATHPHADHMDGVPELLRTYQSRIAEYWDPGYFHTLGPYTNAMRAISAQSELVYAQPTSGFQRWFGDTSVTVLSPSIQLRNRFDTYGVEINDSSISLRLEAPATHVRMEEGRRTYAPENDSAVLVLGADAQTMSWSYVLTEFPFLASSDSAAAKALRAAGGDWDALRADVLKVSHHCSKHGVNLELVERVAPRYTLVSSVAGGGRYNFPHTVSQELIREALNPIASGSGPHPPDWELGLFYTSDKDDRGGVCGTIAAVMHRGRTWKSRCSLWRFGDAPEDDVEFASARRWTPP